MQSTVKKGHVLLRYRKFNQLIIFFLTNVNSSLFRLNFWRAVTYPPLFSDMAIRRAAHCWTDAIFKTLYTITSKFEFSLVTPIHSYRCSWEKLIKYQANSSCVIMSLILMTTLFYKALILQGEIWCWSLLGLKGLKWSYKIASPAIACTLHLQV